MKILIVEDDFYIRSQYSQVFSKMGYEVEDAKDGSEAVKKIISTKFDLILLDLMLPDVNGIDVLRDIKFEKNQNSEVPVFVTTNNDSEEVMSEATKSGAAMCLLKANYTPKQLFEQIDNFMKKLRK